MLAWRGIFGAIGLGVVIICSGERNAWRTFRNMGWRSWLLVGQGAAGMMFYLTALRHTSVANVAATPSSSAVPKNLVKVRAAFQNSRRVST